MRNALFILVVGGLFSVGFIDAANAADALSPSIYAIPVSGQGTLPQYDQRGLLPIRYDDQPQAPLLDQTGRQSAAPQASIVEAIPTPTAFHAGGLLLLVIFLSRFVRKLRWA